MRHSRGEQNLRYAMPNDRDAGSVEHGRAAHRARARAGREKLKDESRELKFLVRPLWAVVFQLFTFSFAWRFTLAGRSCCSTPSHAARYRAGAISATGVGANTLGSPLLALGQLVRTLAAQGAESLAAGDVVTTGTLRPPSLLTAGQTGTATVEGLHVAPLTLELA